MTKRPVLVGAVWMITAVGATVTTDLHATIRDAVKPTSVQLWIREGRS